jgi:hypothetical protein
MTRTLKTKEGGLRATLMSIGAFLLAAAGESAAAAEYASAAALAVVGVLAFIAAELVAQYQFAFEDDLAALIAENDALAATVADAIRDEVDGVDADDVLSGHED